MYINLKNKAFLLKFVIVVLFMCSCKIFSRTHKQNQWYSKPSATTSIVRMSSHFSQDSLQILLLKRLTAMNIEIISTSNYIITTGPDKTKTPYYRYRIVIETGAATASGEYSGNNRSDPFHPNSPESWRAIHYSGDASASVRGFENMLVLFEGVPDALISYNK